MSDEVFIAHRLLDEQIVDSDGNRCGRVDDIELSGSPPRITALLVGEGLYPRRLPRRLRQLARRLAGAEVWGANALRIPWEEVDELGAAVRLRRKAEELGRGGCYRLGLDGKELDSDGMIELLLRWVDAYPIVSIEDPLGEDDPDAFARFTRAAGDRLQVVGDDFLVSDAALVRRAAAAGAANTVLLKPNQRGTLSETRAAWDAARDVGYAGIVSARSGESEDTTIVHLAVGWGTGQLKVGSFARGERMAKWNEALRIEERLGARATLAHPWPRRTR
jgi:sporulation protein YlmC with PRC-barrel domain